MKKYLISLFMLLTSCSSSVIKFTPEEVKLPNARVDSLYQQAVVLTFKESGEVISLSPSNFKAKIIPKDSGLNIEPNFIECENIDSGKCNDSSKVVIKGTPKTKGVITIEIVAKTYASMYSKSRTFVKSYQVFVD